MMKTVGLLVSLLVLGCGDDDRPMDAGTDAAADTGAGLDSGAGVDSGADVDSGPGAVDGGMPSCFPLSGPSVDLPDAIPSSLTAASPTWLRPTGEECPATGLGDTAVPFDTVCYVNDTGGALGVTFEMLVADEPLTPAVVIYDGEAIPADATRCAAVSTDLVIDAAEAYYVVPDGATVTIVATVQEPASGDFQFVITPD